MLGGDEVVGVHLGGGCGGPPSHLGGPLPQAPGAYLFVQVPQLHGPLLRQEVTQLGVQSMTAHVLPEVVE